MKRVICFLLVLAMVLSLAACGGSNKESQAESGKESKTESRSGESKNSDQPGQEHADRYGGTLRLCASNGAVTCLDPHRHGSAAQNTTWQNYVYQSTLVTDPSYNYYPEACDYELSDDWLVLKLWVTEGNQFSDGTPMTIEDVVASMDRYCKYKEALKQVLQDNCIGREVKDGVLTMRFASYRSDLLESIAGFNITKKSILDSLGEEDMITDIKDCIGSNCYKLVEMNPESDYTVARNENYVQYRRDDVEGKAGTHYAYFDKISWTVNTDVNSRTAALLAGQLDNAGISADMKPFAVAAGLKEKVTFNNWNPAIYFNYGKDNPDSIVNSVYFRKAVRACLDMEQIMLSVTGGRADMFQLRATPIDYRNEYYNNGILESVEWNIHDQALAKEYLKKAGYNGEKVVYMTAKTSSFYEAAVIAVQEMEEVGINVELKLVDSGSHTGLRKDHKSGYDIGGSENKAPSTNPVSITSNWPGGIYMPNWDNEVVIKNMEIINSSFLNSKKSIEAFETICREVAEEVPWIVFGDLGSAVYYNSALTFEYQGTDSYWWNSYFTPDSEK